MRFLSLFSGIEAASLAWKPLGWVPVAFAEIDPFACAVLAHHYPDVPNLGDVTEITDAQIRALGLIDVVVAGFPCQDVSVAGQRAGLERDGERTRSGLFFEATRLVRACGARWTVLENVPGLFSSNGGRDFAAVVGALAGCPFDVPDGGWRNAGVAAGPDGLVEWGTLDAQFRGLAQRRERVFLVRDSGAWADRPPILLEPESLRGDPAPRRESGEGLAATLTRGAESGGRGGYAGRRREDDANLVAAPLGSLSRTGGVRNDADTTENLIAGTLRGHPRPGSNSLGMIAHTLRAEGHDASEDGIGRGTPLISMSLCAHAWRQDGESETMIPADCTNGGAGGAVAGTIQAAQSKSNRGQGVMSGSAVRRLTPIECARLQGFPDDYLNVTVRKKPAADGPKYRALGNSIAVPVLRWIGERIQRAVSA